VKTLRGSSADFVISQEKKLSKTIQKEHICTNLWMNTIHTRDGGYLLKQTPPEAVSHRCAATGAKLGRFNPITTPRLKPPSIIILLTSPRFQKKNALASKISATSCVIGLPS